MNKPFTLSAIGGLVLMACAAFLPRQQACAETPSWEHYKVMTENNMFLRDRPRPRPVEKPAPRVVPVRVPERDFVLTGIVQREAGCVAFIEDMRSGETLKLRPGDAVADGEILDIKFDELVYRKGEQSLKITMGNTLEGASSAPAPAPTGVGAEESVTPRATAASPDERAILERLRQRREKELKTQ